MNHRYFFPPALLFALLFTACDNSSAPVHSTYEWNFDSAHANVSQFVDPLIGTGGHGHTFPGATAPFGMVQLSPDTRVDGSWDGCSGYHYDDSIIYGFSHTHLSGTGCSDYGDIMLMPGTAAPYYTPGTDTSQGYRATFSHENETAEAGYYSVKLNNNILCEMTASPRVGVHRYNFNDQIDPWIVLDMSHRDEVLECELEIVNDHTIRGKRFSKAWATNQQLWFYAEFSEPFTHVLWSNGAALNGDTSTAKDLKAMFSFTAQKVEVKVALSPVSCENAKLNMEVETGGMNFDAVKEKVQRNWDSELSRIEIETDSLRKKTIFYTALYHCFIAPNVYCDVNGDYQGMDHKVYRDTIHQRYTVFSLWDTYRALHPLFTIIQQKRTNDFINTFLECYKESGRLPVWELSSNETDCMIGNHSIPVIADAWLKGITDYDTALAFEAMKSASMGDKFGLREYREYGYVPADAEGESVSRTLEYSYDDWCVSLVSVRMHDMEDAAEFGYRACNWMNLYDPETGFFRARLNNGFVEPFRADEVNFHYTEANAWQYSMAAQHDIPRLALCHAERYEAFLDSLFNASTNTTGREQADITGLIGQYAQGNEPSHHMAYLYHYAGKPAKTQRLITKIANELYKDTPDGLCGNEDCGQMSAWYVLSTIGIYPVNPCGGKFFYGLPQFESSSIHFENGHSLIVQKSPNTIIAKDPVNFPSIVFSELAVLDTLIIPQYADTVFNYVFPNIYLEPYYVFRLPAPVIAGGANRTFLDSKTIDLRSLHDGAVLYYSLDSGPFIKYVHPFVITDNAEIRAYAIAPLNAEYTSTPSDTAVARFFKAPAWKSIAIRNAYAPQYSAGGDRALIDGLTGTSNFRTGLWQGYEGTDLDVVIDLGQSVMVDSILLGFLDDENAWIFSPSSVMVDVSDDSTSFSPDNKKASYIAPGGKLSGPHVDRIQLAPAAKGRYLHVFAVGEKVCPKGHPGAGKPAWLFADEITIKTK